MRDPNFDQPKSLAQVRRDMSKTCKVCGEGVSNFDGPGSDVLCRAHQIMQKEYGGYGRIDRPHTFHRSDVCLCCGQDINEDPRWGKAQKYFNIDLNEGQKHEVKRRYNHADHEYRKADGGNDSAENTNPFCSFCHWVKTVINNDGRKSDLS